MGKAPDNNCCRDKMGLRRGPWTAEEDQKLVDYIHRHGHGKWRTLPENAGLKRCGKSCRLRWKNYLRPDIKRGRFSFDEEGIIIQLHSVLGNRWSAIAARLPGRTDNEIKNYWNTHIRKRLLRMGIDPVTHAPCFSSFQLSSTLNSSQLNFPNLLGAGPIISPNLLNFVTTLLPSQSKSLPNINVISQTLQQNQMGNSLAQNQFQTFNQIQNNPIQEIQPCTLPSTTNEMTNLMQSKMEQFFPNVTDFNGHLDHVTSLWQTIDGVADQNSTVQNNFISISDYGYNEDRFITNFLSDDQLEAFDNVQNLSFNTVLSTPSSSTTNLDTSSNTHFNRSGGEDEKDIYCTNFLDYDVPNSLYYQWDYMS